MRVNKRTLKRLIREELEAQGADLDSWWNSLDPVAKQEVVEGHKQKLIHMLAKEAAAHMTDTGVVPGIEAEGEIETAAFEIAKAPEYSILDERDIYAAINQTQLQTGRSIQ